jgi:uncharacterized protein YrzB (UPF0473 family)
MKNNTGFIINEENRQHINLSEQAMLVIEGDMIKFNNDYELKNKSGFINTIISNYHDAFPLSFNVALKQLEQIKTTLKNDDLPSRLTNKVVEEFSTEIMKSLINEYANRYTNEVQFKLKLNKDNKVLIEGLEEADYFNQFAPRSGIAFYIKILLESYARLNREDRERIFYKEIIEMIESAINKGRYLRIKENGKYIKVSPLYIDKAYNEHSLEAVIYYNHNTSENDWVKIDTIKIKEIKEKDPRELKEKPLNKPTEDTIKMVKEAYAKKESSSKKVIETFVVKFTPYGLERFIIEEDSIPLIGIQDQEDETIYRFKTTETKMFHHLFKFGAQAQILSPLNVRNRFKKLYEVSYNSYCENITNGEPFNEKAKM